MAGTVGDVDGTAGDVDGMRGTVWVGRGAVAFALLTAGALRSLLALAAAAAAAYDLDGGGGNGTAGGDGTAGGVDEDDEDEADMLGSVFLYEAINETRMLGRDAPLRARSKVIEICFVSGFVSSFVSGFVSCFVSCFAWSAEAEAALSASFPPLSGWQTLRMLCATGHTWSTLPAPAPLGR